MKVNRTQLVHVLLNLLSNASHVLQQPVAGTAPMIAITSFADSHQHGFSVSDNGPGIPSDIQPKIFQAFVTTKPQGMGIGLAISKRIVEAHGGSIDFSPQIPSGTKFTITIP